MSSSFGNDLYFPIPLSDILCFKCVEWGSDAIQAGGGKCNMEKFHQHRPPLQYFFLFSTNVSFFFLPMFFFLLLLLIFLSLFFHYFFLSLHPGVWWGLFSLPHGKGKAWLKRGFLRGYVSVAGKWILHRTAPYLGHIWPIWPITRPLTALERHKSVAGCYSHIQTNIWPRIAEGLIIPAAFQLLGEKNLCKHRTGRGEAISGLSSTE